MHYFSFTLTVGVENITEDELHSKLMNWLDEQGYMVAVCHKVEEDEN